MDIVSFASPKDPGVDQWRLAINQAAIKADVPPCLLAAIVDRESGGRNVFQEGMPAGPGCGVGLTQITYGVNWNAITDPTFNGYHLLVPTDNLFVAANFFLGPAISECAQAKLISPGKFQASCHGQIVYGASAAYNAGWGAVQEAMDRGYDCDKYTTNNYASYVFDRYLYYVQQSHAFRGQ